MKIELLASVFSRAVAHGPAVACTVSCRAERLLVGSSFNFDVKIRSDNASELKIRRICNHLT